MSERSVVNSALELPIPVESRSVVGWKEVEIRELGEPLVPLGDWPEHDFLTHDAIYFGERETSPFRPRGLEGSLITPFVRAGLAEKLKGAQKLLPEGHLFLIWDAYRTVDVQSALFDHYKKKLAKQNLGLSQEELVKEAQRFVSLPSIDLSKPSPHNTGGVVDLTIVRVSATLLHEIQKEEEKLVQSLDRYYQDANLQEEVIAFLLKKRQIFREFSETLNMGTPFDYVGPETATNHYERLATQRQLSLEEIEILLNRRLLFNALGMAGIDNYEEEWWHYSYGDQMWAKRSGVHAIYGAAALTQKDLVYEEERQAHYLARIKSVEGTLTIGGAWPETEEMYEYAQRIMARFKEAGDPRHSNHPRAVRI